MYATIMFIMFYFVMKQKIDFPQFNIVKFDDITKKYWVFFQFAVSSLFRVGKNLLSLPEHGIS